MFLGPKGTILWGQMFTVFHQDDGACGIFLLKAEHHGQLLRVYSMVRVIFVRQMMKNSIKDGRK